MSCRARSTAAVVASVTAEVAIVTSEMVEASESANVASETSSSVYLHCRVSQYGIEFQLLLREIKSCVAGLKHQVLMSGQY